MVTLTVDMWPVVVLVLLVGALFVGYVLLPRAAQKAVRRLVAELARLVSA